ncbi:hypothetical protein PL11201_40024 [Planktothrix sp. PCC 11201]|nr:hypothetical protein PL11201_40024 [Planktothrix sp. PCC 11201]
MTEPILSLGFDPLTTIVTWVCYCYYCSQSLNIATVKVVRTI